MRVAVIGAGGQDGQLLTRNLLAAGDVVLAVSRASTRLLGGGEQPWPAVDIFKPRAVEALIREFKPDVIYYLAAYHHSSEKVMPLGAELLNNSLRTQVTGLFHFLDAINRLTPETRLFYASSSLIYGLAPAVDLASEDTAWRPGCAYSISKAAGMNLCAMYREQHKIFASCGILFNHESPLRAPNFLSKKIIAGLVDILQERAKGIEIADIAAGADFGYAPDFVEAMQKIMDHDRPDDFIVATGEIHSAQDWLEEAFALAELDWRAHVIVNPSGLGRVRKPLAGSYQKLYNATGWQPSHNFAQMVKELFQAEMQKRA